MANALSPPLTDFQSESEDINPGHVSNSNKVITNELDEYINGVDPDSAFTCMKNHLLDSNTRPMLEEYLPQWHGIAPEGSETFLWRLLQESDSMSGCDVDAFKTILKSDKDAILGVEGDILEQPPLATAIRQPRYREKVKIMIEFMRDEHVKLEGEPGRKCLAAAFDFESRKQRPLESEYVKMLVDLAPPDMLKPRDGDEAELIPLHRVVEFEVCLENPEWQLEVLTFLLDRCEESVMAKVPRKTIYSTWKNGHKQQRMTQQEYSMYQWHFFSKSEFNIGRLTVRNTGQSDPRHSSPFASPTSRAQEGKVVAKGAKQASFTVGRGQMPLARDMKPGAPSPMKDDTGGTYPQSQPGGGAQAMDEVRRQDKAEDNSRKIESELGRRFLRQTVGNDNDELRARQFFEVDGVVKDQKYNFTLGDIEDIQEESVPNFFEKLKFYPVLRHVALPPLRIIPLPPPNRSNRMRQYRYSDQLFFLEWLQKERGVKKIFKVSVDDTDSPHSDEVIVDVLAGRSSRGPAKLQSFDVEILDWKKTDLCPVVIRDSSPDLRELHLHWSGSNVVLRGWSEPEGLPKLKSLKQVHLHYHEKVESSRQIGKYIQQFRDRLPYHIKVIDAGTVSRTLGGTQSAAGTATMANIGVKREDPWLKYIDDFNAMVPDFPRKAEDDPAARNVTVALIDDGVNFLSPQMANFQRRFVRGRSFDVSSGVPMPEFQSLGGHGTFMAKLILRVCPHANIIPYRLKFEADDERNIPRPEPKSAAKAIREAIKDGVDIISMSWTIKRGSGGGNSTQKQKDFKELKEVLRWMGDAGFGSTEKPIPLMFGAASDDGLSTSSGEEFPFAIEGDIFRIGAAERTGQAWPAVSNQNDVHFFFPGVDFKLPENADLNSLRNSNNSTLPEEQKGRDGSSVATALAAGLAALLIHCTKLGVYHTVAKQEVFDPISPDYIDDEQPVPAQRTLWAILNTLNYPVDKLANADPSGASVKRFQTMKRVFNELSSTNGVGGKFTSPITEFENATQTLKSSYNMDGPIELPKDAPRLAPIARLVRNLVRAK